MRFSRSTFLRNTQPRSRGAFFAPSAETARSMFRPLFGASVTRLTKPLWFSALKSAAAHNDANLASGGGHGTQSNEVRTRLLDGPCGGSDHPGDQTVGGRARLAEQVGGANSGAGHHLPAATLESVLRARQAVRGTNNAFLTPHRACRDGCPQQRPLRARHASAEAVYDTAPVDRLTSLSSVRNMGPRNRDARSAGVAAAFSRGRPCDAEPSNPDCVR